MKNAFAIPHRGYVHFHFSFADTKMGVKETVSCGRNYLTFFLSNSTYFITSYKS